MRFSCSLLILLLGAGRGVQAQPLTRSPFVRASGQGTVSANPDLARIDFSVVTQAPNAQAASTQNATQVNTLIGQLQALLGASGDIKTINYALTPNYNYPANGGTPILTGYTASNTVEVTTGDLGNVGRVIDTGIQAGANQVSGLQFGLKDDQPARTQALKLATAQAKVRADAMAAGAGMHTGAYHSIEEGIAVRAPVLGTGASAPTTPIVSGRVEVVATVTVEIDLVP